MPTDPVVVRKLHAQLDSLDTSLQRYKDHFGDYSPAIAHIYKSMAKTLEHSGDGIGAAVRGGEAGVAMVSGGGMSEDKPGGGTGKWAD